MKNKVTVKMLCVVLAVCFAVFGLAACGSKTIKVTVNDAGTKAEVEIDTGKKVSDALAAAKITLGEKDECVPKPDEKIAEDTKEIVVLRYAKVTIVKDGKNTSVELVGGTVEEALKKANITLADGESTDVDLKSYLKDGMTITVTAALKVSLTADGKTTEVTTKAATVKALLDEQKITLGKDDEVSEKLDAKVTAGMKIVVKRVEYKTETKTEEIAYTTEEQYSDSMAEGTSEVTQQGVTGEKEVTYKVKYVDGKEESREKDGEKVTKEAVNEIVTYGTASEDAGGYDSGDNNSGDSGSDDGGSSGKKVVDRQPMPDCDADGHGTYIVTYDDGSVGYEVY